MNAAGIPGEEKLPGEAGYGFTYAFVSPTTIEITAYYGYEAEVTVPSTIDGYTVVGIQSFHNEEGYSNPNIFVRKVVLPETVTYIADGAFYDGDDWSAKTHFELREIVLPQSLKTIGKNAFYHNYYLQKIDIPAGCDGDWRRRVCLLLESQRDHHPRREHPPAWRRVRREERLQRRRLCRKAQRAAPAVAV